MIKMNKELYEHLKSFINICNEHEDCAECEITKVFGDCIFIDTPDIWKLGDDINGKEKDNN